MSLIGLVVALILLGVGLYLVNTLIPMDARIKTLLNVLVIVVVVLWILSAFGLFSMGPIPRLR